MSSSSQPCTGISCVTHGTPRWLGRARPGRRGAAAAGDAPRRGRARPRRDGAGRALLVVLPPAAPVAALAGPGRRFWLGGLRPLGHGLLPVVGGGGVSLAC